MQLLAKSDAFTMSLDAPDAGEVRTAPLTTLAAAAAFVGVDPGAPPLRTHKTALRPDATVTLDPTAMAALSAWYSSIGAALEQLRTESIANGAEASPVQLWPEDFDLATTIGAVNFGGSPGDAHIAEPYAYVGPHARPLPHTADPFWNESFGAARRHHEIASSDDALAFFRAGAALAAS